MYLYNILLFNYYFKEHLSRGHVIRSATLLATHFQQELIRNFGQGALSLRQRNSPRYLPYTVKFNFIVSFLISIVKQRSKETTKT